MGEFDSSETTTSVSPTSDSNEASKSKPESVIHSGDMGLEKNTFFLCEKDMTFTGSRVEHVVQKSAEKYMLKSKCHFSSFKEQVI